MPTGRCAGDVKLTHAVVRQRTYTANAAPWEPIPEDGLTDRQLSVCDGAAGS
jgi:hypothetical protein